MLSFISVSYFFCFWRQTSCRSKKKDRNVNPSWKVCFLLKQNMRDLADRKIRTEVYNLSKQSRNHGKSIENKSCARSMREDIYFVFLFFLRVFLYLISLFFLSRVVNRVLLLLASPLSSPSVCDILLVAYKFICSVWKKNIERKTQQNRMLCIETIKCARAHLTQRIHKRDGSQINEPVSKRDESKYIETAAATTNTWKKYHKHIPQNDRSEQRQPHKTKKNEEKVKHTKGKKA